MRRHERTYSLSCMGRMAACLLLMTSVSGAYAAEGEANAGAGDTALQQEKEPVDQILSRRLPAQIPSCQPGEPCGVGDERRFAGIDPRFHLIAVTQSQRLAHSANSVPEKEVRHPGVVHEVCLAAIFLRRDVARHEIER